MGDAQGKRGEELVSARSRRDCVASVASMAQKERVELAMAEKLGSWARLRLGTREFECAVGRHGSLEGHSRIVGGWAAGRRERGKRRCGADGTLFGGEASNATQRALMAVGAARGGPRGARVIAAGGSGRGGGLAEEELEAAERGSLGGMEQTEGADAMDAAQRHVLEIAAKKLASG